MALALLCLHAMAIPARAGSHVFTVELFSGKTVRALTIEAEQQSVTLCGAKTDGPCMVLRPRQCISCSADNLIHCRSEASRRNFAMLTISAAGPFGIRPSFAGTGGATQALLARNAHASVVGTGLRVLTQVDLESYVAAAVQGEASILRALAAREAMAILLRTWALHSQGRHCAQGFDFCSLTHCLAFHLPHAGEANGADEAVLKTRGEVLMYHGALADPYFSACCGGMTEAAGNVWPDRAQPYLIAIHDAYCLGSYYAEWKRELSTESVQQVLREALHLPIAAPLTELAVGKRDASGRALVLRIVAGSTWNVDANEFRYALDRRMGWGEIKSNRYAIARHGDAWVFSGQGLGHGVGLCEAGAEQMGRIGFSAQQILSTYFPGTEISSIPSDSLDPVAVSEHFELFYPASQEPWAKQTLETLEEWRKELSTHAEALPPRLRVQTEVSTAEFIRVTGQPGWMAGVSDGQAIVLQPLALLAGKKILKQTLRHELTHIAVHRVCAKGVPRWFEEGLVLYVTGERIVSPRPTSNTGLQLEQAISSSRCEAEMKAAYAHALERVRQLAGQRGEGSLWRVLEHPSAEDFRWLRAPH